MAREQDGQLVFAAVRCASEKAVNEAWRIAARERELGRLTLYEWEVAKRRLIALGWKGPST